MFLIEFDFFPFKPLKNALSTFAETNQKKKYYKIKYSLRLFLLNKSEDVTHSTLNWL